MSSPPGVCVSSLPGSRPWLLGPGQQGAHPSGPRRRALLLVATLSAQAPPPAVALGGQARPPAQLLCEAQDALLECVGGQASPPPGSPVTLTSHLWTPPIQVLQEGLIARGVPSLPLCGGRESDHWLAGGLQPPTPTLDVFTPRPGLRTGHWMGRTGLGPGQAGGSAGHGCPVDAVSPLTFQRHCRGARILDPTY